MTFGPSGCEPVYFERIGRGTWLSAVPGTLRITRNVEHHSAGIDLGRLRATRGARGSDGAFRDVALWTGPVVEATVQRALRDADREALVCHELRR